MSENPVVIKINFANKSIARADQQSEVITEWHIPRILGALCVVLALLIGIWPSASTDSVQNSDAKTETQHEVETQQLKIAVVPQATSTPTTSTPNRVVEPVKPPVPTSKTPEKTEEVVYSLDSSKPAAVIYDRHVVRAALVAEIKDQKPGPRVQPNISVSDSGQHELFYFTEIKHPNQSAYVHQWLKNGQQVLKKNLPVKGDLPSLISSKKFSSKDKGVWSVVLLDNKGKSLSESRFVVN